jgi:hypothetical protein
VTAPTPPRTHVQQQQQQQQLLAATASPQPASTASTDLLGCFSSAQQPQMQPQMQVSLIRVP